MQAQVRLSGSYEACTALLGVLLNVLNDGLVKGSTVRLVLLGQLATDRVVELGVVDDPNELLNHYDRNEDRKIEKCKRKVGIAVKRLRTALRSGYFNGQARRVCRCCVHVPCFKELVSTTYRSLPAWQASRHLA